MSRSSMALRAFNEMFPDEDAARAWFEKSRWPHGPECPKCGSIDRSSWLKMPRRWNCIACHHQFSVTTGTPMHRTHLPLLTWAHAIYLIVSSSKGIAAMKLSEMLGISYPAAWHLGHRIRAMMAEANPILAGVVEIDEMYAGAPPRKRAKSSRDHDDDQQPKNPQGRGTKRSLVLVAAKRGGDVVAKVIRTHGKGAITSALDGVLNDTATVMTDGLPAYKHIGKTQPHHAVNHSAREYARTDELPAYRWIGSKFPAHLHVNHSKGEYVRRDPLVAATAHTNTAESFNATLKRAVIGVWHWFSTKHTDRYLSEVSFRWNRRKQGADARPAGLFTGNGGRLRWKELVA